MFDDFAEYPHVVNIPGWADRKTILQKLIDERTGMPTAPRMVVVVDELPHDDYYDLDTRTGLVATLGNLMRHARALGIHVLISAQTLPSALAAQLANNSNYRIALRTTTVENSRDLIGSTLAHELPTSPGLGLFRPSQRADPLLFRAFQIPPDLVRDVGRQLATASGSG